MADTEKREENGGRDPATGKFAPGNKGGGRRPMPPEVREILEAGSVKAATRLVEGLDAMQYVGIEGRAEPHWKERREYAVAIHQHLYGKPAQALTNEDGSPLFGQSDVVVAALKKLAGE